MLYIFVWPALLILTYGVLNLLEALTATERANARRIELVVQRMAARASLPRPKQAQSFQADSFVLKPMASAPIPQGDEYFKVLVLEEYSDMGQVCRMWSLVYWLDAFDGRPSGWYGENCGDLRNPIGWVLSTKELGSLAPSLSTNC